MSSHADKTIARHLQRTQSLIDEIFLDAVAIESHHQRSAFLDDRCKGLQGSVRAAVEKLLAADGDAQDAEFSLTSFYVPENDLSAQTEPDHGSNYDQERLVGRYHLLQKLGEGGMGVVYMADQKEPVRRRVAVKLVKPGMDSKHVIARFEAERQALAMMDHQNIAKVLDVGTTESGRPFFVMELVKGRPITQYCDDMRLNVEERLRLFVSVCQAVQHAHQKGIIHRDIKPSNVLVAEYDDRAVPKVIDFGLAKAFEQPLTEKTLFTQLGQVVGTFEYMSPEQAKLNQLDIDTRTDIYSLGVLLYELLTGHTPHDSKTLRGAAFDEMLRIIREAEPATPSAKLASSESSASAAQCRQSEPSQLTRRLKGDLDAIAMKALDKDRSRRYTSSAALAEDISCFLNDEPITAARPSYARYWMRFARRNRAAVAAITSIIVVLATTTAISTVLWIRAERLSEQRDTLSNTLSSEQKLAIRADMQLANSAWKSGDVNRTRELLDKHIPVAGAFDVRRFEWGYLSRLWSEMHNQSPFLAGRKEIRFLAFRGPESSLFAAHQDTLTTIGSQRNSITLRDISPFGFGVDVSPQGDLAVFATDNTHQGFAELVLFDLHNSRQLDAINYYEHIRRIENVLNREELIDLPAVRILFSPDGKFVATTHPDETFVLLWRVLESRSLEFDKVLYAPPAQPEYDSEADWIKRLVFSHDSSRLAAAGSDGKVRVWSLSSDEEAVELKHRGVAYALAFTHDDRQLIVGSSRALSMGMRITFWNTESWEQTMLRNRIDATTFVLSPGSKQLATANFNGLVRLVDLKSFETIREFRGHIGKISQMTFAADGATLATAGESDEQVFRWPLTEPPKSASGAQSKINFHQSGIHTLAFHPSKNHVAAVDEDGLVSVFNADTEELLQQYNHGSYLDHVEFVESGKKLAIGAGGTWDGGGTWIWDLQNPEQEAETVVACWVIQHPKFPYCFRVRGDWGSNQAAAVYKNFSSSEIEFALFRKPGFHPIGFGVASFAPRSPLLTVGGKNGWIATWDVNKQTEVWSHPSGHSSHVTGCATSPDELNVATSSLGGNCIIWELQTGARRTTLVGHSAAVHGIDYSPSGESLATASIDGTVRLWDPETGDERFRFESRGAGFNSVRFSPDGNVLAAADGDGTIWLWRSLPEITATD